FIAQVLLGALSYLIPVVMGGGPGPVRGLNRDVDAGGALRIAVANGGLVVCVLPVPERVRLLASAVVLLSFASFVPILLWAIRRRHSRGDDHPTMADVERPKGQNTGLAAVGVAIVMIAVALGGAIDPAALSGQQPSAGSGVT